MKEIFPQHIATFTRVAAHVKGARIVGVEAHITDLIALDHMVIAVQPQAKMRCIMDQIAARTLTNTGEPDARAVGTHHAIQGVNVVVLGHISGWRQRAAITSTQENSTLAAVVDVTPNHAIATAFDGNRMAAKIAQFTAAQKIVLAAQHDAQAPSAFDDEIMKCDVLHIRDGDQRLVQKGHLDRSFGKALRWPQVQQSFRPIDIPFACLTDLFEQIHHHESFGTAHAIK